MEIALTQARATMELDQFDEYGDAGQLPADVIRQIETAVQGSAGSKRHMSVGTTFVVCETFANQVSALSFMA